MHHMSAYKPQHTPCLYGFTLHPEYFCLDFAANQSDFGIRLLTSQGKTLASRWKLEYHHVMQTAAREKKLLSLIHRHFKDGYYKLSLTTTRIAV